MTNTTNTAANEASAHWIESHADYLFNFAVGQVRDMNVAEDLVQDTFLAALKAHDRFTGQSTERTWLVGILRHKIYDHLRRACRERAVRAEVPKSADEESNWEDAMMWLHDAAVESQSPISIVPMVQNAAPTPTACTVPTQRR
jgi:RNA polymerase sigma factor (sigma-70 family)